MSLLPKFDILNIKKPSYNLIIGKRGVGKTYLIKDLLYHLNISKGNIVCNNIFDRDFYKKIIDKIYIYDNNQKENVLKNIKKYQEKLRHLKKMDNVFLVYDDVIYNNSIHTDILRICYENRHYLLTIVNTMQYYNNLPSHTFNNIEYLFIFPSINKHESNKLFKYIHNLFPNMTFETMNKLFYNLELYECMVIDTYNKKLYRYKASEHKYFNINNKIFAIITFQKYWRKILAKRQLQRLKIKNELEYIPEFGIKYFEAKSNWNILLESNKEY
jgi:hypothetical protein